MRTENKIKPASSKLSRDFANLSKKHNHIKPSQHQIHTKQGPQSQQFTQFHLNDQQPESLNAKRKLQQISVEFQEQQAFNPHKRNQDTIKLFRRNQNDTEKNAGWNYKNNQQKNLFIQKKNEKNTSAFYNSNYEMNQSKFQNERRFSYFNKKSLNHKVQFSFNNLPFENLNDAHLSQFTRQIAKKAKTKNTIRPNTAYYEGASQKVLKLFDNDQQRLTDNGLTLRIHSGKDLQKKKGNLVTFKARQNFLKSCPFNLFGMNSTKKNELKKPNTKVITQNDEQNKGINQNQKVINKKSHYRTYSEPVQHTQKQKNCGVNLKRQSLTHRKNRVFVDRRMILDKKIKSQSSLEATDVKLFSNQRQLVNVQTQQIQVENKESQDKKIQERVIEQKKSSKHAKKNNLVQNQNYHKKKIEAPLSSNIEQDFATLINLLKYESHNVFGGQLHSYLNQMKGLRQNNFYMSTAVNKNKNKKNNLKVIMRSDKDDLNQVKAQNMYLKAGIRDQSVAKNNTTMHYTSLSMSKHKFRESGFLIGMEKQFTN